MNPYPQDEVEDFSRLRERVWEIGLAVLTHRGVCPLFRYLNRALDQCNLRQLRLIHGAALAFPPELKAQFWGETACPEKTREAVLLLETLLLDLIEQDEA